jgi:ribosomal-protein-alanine N-acetyltransferase
MERKAYNTKRLIIRPFEARDYELWAWSLRSARPRKNRFDWEPEPGMNCGRKAFRALLARQKKMAERDQTYIWAIFDKNTGALLGRADVYVIQRLRLQVANLGYRLDNRYWGQGFGKEAVAAIAEGAFKDLELNRLEAVIDLDNKASIALVRSVGLVREGIRKKYYYQNGKWDDQVVFVALREEFGLKPLRPKA